MKSPMLLNSNWIQNAWQTLRIKVQVQVQLQLLSGNVSPRATEYIQNKCRSTYLASHFFIGRYESQFQLLQSKYFLEFRFTVILSIGLRTNFETTSSIFSPIGTNFTLFFCFRQWQLWKFRIPSFGIRCPIRWTGYVSRTSYVPQGRNHHQGK